MSKYPFYPVVMSLAFAISFATYNIVEVSFWDTWRVMLVLLISSTVLVFLINVFVKNIAKSAAIAAYFLFWFLFYGYAKALIGNNYFLSSYTGVTVGAFILVLMLFLGWGLLRCKADFSKATNLLNIISIAFILFTIFSNFSLFRKNTNELVGETGTVGFKSNIYYIVLDTYGRKDVLLEDYGFDNSEFINFLKAKGFYVSDTSSSNYVKTYWSLASALNMVYVDELTDGNLESGRKLSDMVSNNKVSQILKANGYKYYYISSGLFETDMEQYARVFAVNDLNYLNYYERSFIKTTLLSIVAYDDFDMSFGGNIFYAFDTLKTLKLDEPTFVFSHIMCPHGPFIFASDGSPTINGGNYTDQVIFVNNKMKEVINGILTNDKTNLIIIIQGDHGNTYPKNGEEAVRVQNLSAIYMSDYNIIYDGMTSVNIFRQILNKYFSTNFVLLEDRSSDKLTNIKGVR